MTTAWTAHTAWMRDVGAVHATWSESGVLLSCTLGPVPAVRATDEELSDRRVKSAADERAAYQRIALGAGARLEPREK